MLNATDLHLSDAQVKAQVQRLLTQIQLNAFNQGKTVGYAEGFNAASNN